MKKGDKIFVVVEKEMMLSAPIGSLWPAVVILGGDEPGAPRGWFLWSWESRADQSGWDGSFDRSDEGVAWCRADDPTAVAALRVAAALR